MEVQQYPGNEPLLFKDLPKEQRKALQKEFNQTPEGKKSNRNLILITIVIAIVGIAFAVIITMMTGSSTSYYPTLLFIVPALISQNKFEKWLLAEKNIVISKKKARKN